MPAVSFCPQKRGEQQDGPLLALRGGCSNTGSCFSVIRQYCCNTTACLSEKPGEARRSPFCTWQKPRSYSKRPERGAENKRRAAWATITRGRGAPASPKSLCASSGPQGAAPLSRRDPTSWWPGHGGPGSRGSEPRSSSLGGSQRHKQDLSDEPSASTVKTEARQRR